MAEIGEGSVLDGRYRVLRKIGAGGMADVWLAEDSHLQRQVALKVLHQRFAQDREFVERFRREAEAAAGLQHPNVVAIFDRGDVDGTYYIAMECLHGHSLKQLIDAGLTPRQAVALVRQVLEAARFAHRHGIVHRDLKPQNVIVDDEGKAKVTDFGIARAGVSEITQTGSVMGTAHYLSPEQAQSLEVTPESDLYSIGVILYEALTGRVPFEGESAVAVALKQVSQSPQRPSSLSRSVSPALDAVVMRALEKDPESRFRSADAFIAALDEAMRAPEQAGGETASFAPLPPPEAPVAETAAEEEEEERRRLRRLALIALAVLLGVLLALYLTRDTDTEVPSVTGNQLQVAIDLLQQDGFEVGEIVHVRRDVARNLVLEQDPSGEASLDCGFLRFFCSEPEVGLTVSGGPGRGIVPSTAGLSRSAAERELEDAGFGPRVRRVSSAEVETGLVIFSEPSGGTSLRRGSEVTITVSTGPREVSVPVLVGSQRNVAVERIRGRGLEPSVSEQRSSQPVGRVLSQSPSAGTSLPEGSTVSIVVSSGVERVAMPGVVGLERPDAVAELRAAGLVVNVVEEETDVPAQAGRVLSQEPSGGTRVERGSEVAITVGRPAPASDTDGSGTG